MTFKTIPVGNVYVPKISSLNNLVLTMVLEYERR